MAGLASEEMLLSGRNGKPIVGGFFAVPKPPKPDKLKRQMLIFDRRPQNQTERRLPWVSLPHACLFRRAVLGRRMCMRGSGKDLSNFYLALRHHSAWWGRNAVGRRVRRKTAKDFEKSWVLDPPHWSHEKRRRTQRRMVMLVAGMGDQNTSDVATRIHENVLDFAGLFPESERLSYKKLVPKGRVWAGAYIDGWLCVYFCQRSEIRQPGPDTTRDCDTSAL
jgi:hypothetical protein